MLDFTDQPYRYFPPRPNRLVAWFLLRHNRRRYLPRKQRITSVKIEGADNVRDVLQRGDALLLLPNHPTHADAAIFIEALWQAGVRTRMMAAYDVFLRGRLDAWVMQKLGAFSVDREGSDQRAMKEAIRTLTELSRPLRRTSGGWALTIFPEGNVYLENDRVTPFNDGAAFLAIRAAKQLAEQSPPRRVWAVPVSIKVTHTTDVRAALRDKLTALAAKVGVTIDTDGPPLDAMKTIGIAALRRNLQHRGITCDSTDDLKQLIEASADTVLSDLEYKLGLKAKPDATPIDRVRAARRMIHEVRTDPQREIDHTAARVWADQAMLAFRIASYSGRYVAERPSLDRVGETIEKLDEDMHGRWPEPFADRAAIVRFNQPIDVSDYLPEKKTRLAVQKLTRDCEASVQAGLDAINAANTHPGAKLWEA